MKLAMGQYDAPQVQKQEIFRLDPYRSNIAVFGSPMSGKTTFVKTLLVRLHENMRQQPGENIYLIDFGGNIGAYGKLRNVCACFDNSNEENIKRVFRTIEKRLDENARLLDSQSYYTLVSKSPEKAPTHMFLIIENINAFLTDDRYASYQDRLIRFCRDGLSKGLTVVITANDTRGLSRLLANFGQRVAFEMPGESYFDIFNTKVNKPMKVPGRGIINMDSAIYEFQCFLPFAAVNDEEPIRALVEQTARYPNEHIMAAFSDVLTRENAAAYCASEHLSAGTDEIVVGLDYYEHKPVGVNIAESRSIAIYGKRRFGKSNLLTVLLEGIRQIRPEARFVYLDDGRKQLTPFYMPGEKQISANAEYFTDIGLFRDYLTEAGYGGLRRNAAPAQPRVSEIRQTPFTVFVLQAKLLYRNSPDARYLMGTWFPVMIGDAENRDYLFIFSDVGNISEADLRAPFNDNVSVAFLLDNIGEFVAEKGNKTVFGEMDARELKAEYAKCAVGDGYIYDTEADELQKLKFMKAD